MSDGTEVYLEAGRKRVFAAAVDWPGWCRSGRSEEGALAALADYLPRYGPVVREAGLELPAGELSVVERMTGNATTEFGAPGVVPALDAAALPAATAQRLAAVVAACWVVLDRVAAAAPPTLRKGPRGGGRDRDAVVAHVVEAERSYARQVAVRHPPYREPDAREAMRAELLGVLGSATEGPPAKGWPTRYAARRIGWHVLDHAWEIEDRS